MQRPSIPMLVVLTVCAAAPGQQAPLSVNAFNWPVASAVLANTGSAPAAVWSTTINLPGVTSIQIAFGDVNLGSELDHVLIRDPHTNDSQILDPLRLKQWSNQSAWFNSNLLVVELWASPGSTVSASIDHLLCGVGPVGPDSLCDSDNRVPAATAFVCRFISSSSATAGGSSGFMMHAPNVVQGGMVVCGQGASVGGSIVIAEFNVPPSNSSGSIVHPPVADQYPVDQTSILSANTGVGNNWAVMRLHPNSSGQTVDGRQGVGLSQAASIPGLTTQLQINSFGADTTASRNFAEQTDHGPFTFVLGDTISYWVDTDTGSAGAPVLVDSTNEVIAIHTTGGCNPALGQSNNGTSILNANLQSAIAATKTCQTILAVTPGQSAATNLACSPRALAITPSNSSWNVVAVIGAYSSAGDDLDLEIDGVTSSQANGLCDFLISNGNLNPNLAPVSGYVHRSGSPGESRVQFDTATTLAIGSSTTLGWNITNGVRALARIVEFNVATAGTYDVTVAGPFGLKWRLYAPGSTTAWRPRSEAALASGTVGGNTVDSVSLGVGWHAIVIFEDFSGSFGLSPVFGISHAFPETVSVAIAAASPDIALTANGGAVGVPSLPAGQDFSLTPAANVWNAVALTTPPNQFLFGNWNLFLGPAQSRNGTGLLDFAVANGHLGAIPTSEGAVARASGILGATMQHVTELASGATEQLATGRMIAVEPLTPSSGLRRVLVTGGGGASAMRWYVMNSLEEHWMGPDEAAATDVVGGTFHSVTLDSAALVVVSDDGPVSAARPYTAHVTTQGVAASFTTLGQKLAVTTDRLVSVTPSVNNWNAFGVVGPAGTNWDAFIATGESQSASGLADFVIADGHAGTIAVTDGIVERRAGTGTGTLQLASIVTASLFTPTSVSFQTGTPDDIIKIVQFDVTTPGNHSITVNGAAASWALFRPRSDSQWVSRADADFSGTSGSGAATVALPTSGTHALVIFGDAAGPAGSVTVTVVPPSPVPFLSIVLPNSTTAGSGGGTIALTGSGFTPTSSVHFGATAIPTTFVSSISLQANIPAGLLATGGIVPVTVVNPAPGGGSSPAVNFTINNPSPSLVSVSPANVTALGSTFTLAVSGSQFNSQSVVRWNGVNLTTGLVNTTQLSATVPASLIAQPGTAAVTVFNPTPAGGSSAPQTVTIFAPGPGLVSLSPSQIDALSPAFTMTVNGLAFVNTSVVRWNGASIPTTFVSATQLTAQVSAALLSSGGFATVTVFTPPPSGGSSNALTFLINNPLPVVNSVAPSVVTAGGAAFTITVTGSSFVPASVAQFNGTPLTTTVNTSTSLTASVPATLIAAAGQAQVTVTSPAPAGGSSGSANVTVQNPAPIAAASSPAFLLAGSAGGSVALSGSGFTVQSVVKLDGVALATSFASATQLNASIPANLPLPARAATLAVLNPGPGGGLSAGLAFLVKAPHIATISPTVISPLTTGGPSATVTLTGSDFVNGSVVYANQTALVTTFVSATQLTATVPSTLAVARQAGGIAIGVESFGTADSNTVALEVTHHQNRGTLDTTPLGPAPGEVFSILLEGGVANAPFTLLLDGANITPIVPFPDPTSDFVLSVNLGTMSAIVDGIGLLGTPSLISLGFDPSGTAPGGKFILPGVLQPNPPLGFPVTLQFVYLDPSHPSGLRMSHGLSRYQL